MSRFVRNGRDTSFWDDAWLLDEPLRRYMIKEVVHSDMQARVRDYWITNVGWDWTKIMEVLPY